MYNKLKSKTIFWTSITIGIFLALISQTINNDFLSYSLLSLGILAMFISLFFLVKSGFESTIAVCKYWFHKFKGDI
ncbi:hypothetical protein [Enterococcus rivorum]|uniref:Uncharacterized protein n=1 Tax=Enterococcus rivorum TaxID=762845 RepID=A0A1E5KTB8_9ENTE|nr:hypothetical protein [Enterococcus rivorum]MBP2100731.1 hypothetical protein [Enterococcus rivorum]OEH81142.1 hypothetical protein BCR26_17425 [Enterococcus rivorum]